MNALLQIIIRPASIPEEKNTFLGISYDGWFTGITPILLFILGYIINRLIENNKENKRLKELEKYFKSSIELLKKPLELQQKAFVKTSKILKEKKEQHIILEDVTNFHVNLIKEISNKDLYTIFIINKKGAIEEKTQLYAKLRASIDYIDNLKVTYKKDFEKFWKSYDTNQQEYKKNIEVTDQAFGDMISQSNPSSIQRDEFLHAVDEIRFKWMSFKKTDVEFMDMYIAKELYLEPLRELCKINMHDPRASLILKHVMLSIYAFHNIAEAKYVFRRLFLLNGRDLQNRWTDINQIIGKFDKM